MEIATIVLTGVTVLIAAFALWAARATLREARETVKLARDAQAKSRAARTEERKREAADRELNRLFHADERLEVLAQNIEKVVSAAVEFPLNRRWFDVANALLGVRVSSAAVLGQSLPSCVLLTRLHVEKLDGTARPDYYSHVAALCQTAREEVAQARGKLNRQIRDAVSITEGAASAEVGRAPQPGGDTNAG